MPPVCVDVERAVTGVEIPRIRRWDKESWLLNREVGRDACCLQRALSRSWRRWTPTAPRPHLHRVVAANGPTGARGPVIVCENKSWNNTRELRYPVVFTFAMLAMTFSWRGRQSCHACVSCEPITRFSLLVTPLQSVRGAVTGSPIHGQLPIFRCSRLIYSNVHAAASGPTTTALSMLVNTVSRSSCLHGGNDGPVRTLTTSASLSIRSKVSRAPFAAAFYTAREILA